MPPTRTTSTSSSSRARMPRPTVVGSSSRLSNAQPGGSRRRSPTPDSVTEDDESHTDEDDTGPYIPTSMRPRQRVRRTPSAAPAAASSASARPVVVISSDEEDEGQGAGEQRAAPSRPRATRRAQRHTATSGAVDAMDTDPAGASTSTSAATTTSRRPDGFLVERVVRRPQPIVLNDSDATAGASASATATSSSSTNAAHAALASNGLPLPQTSPPRGKPPLVAHPLLSKYTCPICLCAPHPYAVSTPCGHVFCSDCLFEALQVPAKQKQDEYRQQVAAFSAFTSGGYGWPASFFGMGMGMGGAGAVFGGGGGPGDAGGPGGGGDGGGPTAAAAGGAGGTTSSGGATSTSSGSNSANAARLDPLVGPCPVCRATIPGGFIRSAAASTSTNASGSKRPVFGLQFKLGKPIDDPRRE